MKSIKRIYIEKPICISKDEEHYISKSLATLPTGITIQAGFQFLQMATVRKALHMWRECNFGDLIHFQCRYLHSGYLRPEYRKNRLSRLKPCPVGGVLADLGSHLFSFILAFLGEGIQIITAEQSGRFSDVPVESDLCTIVFLKDSKNGAIGTIATSRISAGAGEVLDLEFRCTNGSLRLSTNQPDVLEIFSMNGRNEWKTIYCGSDFMNTSKFPSQHVSPGWLRSLIHAHYLFFGGKDILAKIPDLGHALAVQRLINSAAEKLLATHNT